MSRHQRPNPLYLLTGLLIGLGLGLLFALVIMPVQYTDTAPDSLAPEYKDAYRALIAQAFAADGDVGRAWARLVLLGDANPREVLAAQAQSLAVDPARLPQARALAQLSVALGQPQALATRPAEAGPTATLAAGVTPQPTLDPNLAVRSPTPLTPTLTPTATFTPTITPTPRSSPTPTATLGAPYQLLERKSACDQFADYWDTLSLIEVTVLDAAGTPVPGVRVLVSWEGGQDVFYTGLFPEYGPGYADFEMTPNTAYSVQVGEGGEVAANLVAPACQDSNDVPYWGRWRLTFQQP